MKVDILKGLSKVKTFAGMKFEVYKPEIFLGVGLACIGIGVIEACKATLDSEEVLSDAIEDVADVKMDVAAGIITKEEKNKELAMVYLKTGKELAKRYWKAFVLFALGLTSIFKGQGILKDRYVKLLAGYKLLEDGYSEYRQRVINELGEEADKRFQYGLKQEKKAIDVVTVDENGEVSKEKVKNALVSDYESHSPYSRFFDETSDCWSPSPEYNKTYILAQEKTANDKLRSRGWLSLAEVYEMLGFEATEASLAVGWVMGNGENKVKFNIFDTYNEATRRFVNGYEPSILLDFNVDGVILDKLRTIGLAQI